MVMTKVVTRFAPSPTGNPHVGNIHVAIFSYLLAKHEKGNFLLRIEDTDRERLVPESLKQIEESLSWLGIEYDGEKIFQSDRREIHQKYAEQLLSIGKAYKCFCSKERLDKLRIEQQKKKLPPGYDRHCRNLTPNEILDKEKEGNKYVIRFAMPKSKKAVWDDVTRGRMEIDYSVSDDPIILKSDGWPTYHLASVVDDNEMKVTDVIRGEEWIPSTPKHIALYEAFEWVIPRFAHVPHINGTGGKKLSKRDGDTAILDYRDKGYLPEAMFNFLALLGWNEGNDKEVYTRDELIKSFSIKRIGKSPAVFDAQKLDWINGQYIRGLSDKELVEKIKELYPKEKITMLSNFEKIVTIEKTRLSRLSDMLSETEYFITPQKYNQELLVFKKSNMADTKKGLTLSLEIFENINWKNMTAEDFEKTLAKIVENNSLSNGDVFWPVRVALSGLEKSPSPAELLWVFGKKESFVRIKDAISLIRNT